MHEPIFDSFRLVGGTSLSLQIGHRLSVDIDLFTDALMNQYTISDMIALHQVRYEWTHDRALILDNFLSFDSADQDLDPVCLRGNEWIFMVLAA